MRKFKTWEASIEAYIENASIGRTRQTLRAIRVRLAHVSSLSETPRSLTKPAYLAWISAKERELSSSYFRAINGDLIRLLRFINHPLAEALSLHRVHVPESPIPTFSPRQLLQVNEWCFSAIDSPIAWRRRMAVYLLIAMTTGSRSAEICSLRWRYWTPELGRFRLMETKTKRARWAVVGVHTIPLIEKWRLECEGDFVIPSLLLSHEPSSPNAIREKMKVVAQELGFESLRTKDFRSTVAKMIFEETGSLELTAQTLGHESIETTRRFYHRMEADSKTALAVQTVFNKLLGAETI